MKQPVNKLGSCREAQVIQGSEGRGCHVTLFRNEEHLGALDSLAMAWGHRKVLINRRVPPKGKEAFAEVPRK